jgi:hypothetical protein
MKRFSAMAFGLLVVCVAALTFSSCTPPTGQNSDRPNPTQPTTPN